MDTNICIYSKSVPLYIFELWGTHVRTILKDSLEQFFRVDFDVWLLSAEIQTEPSDPTVLFHMILGQTLQFSLKFTQFYLLPQNQSDQYVKTPAENCAFG